MKSIDALLNRQYDATHYHCVHFVVDAAQYLFGRDYTDGFLGLTGTVNSAHACAGTKVIHNQRLNEPIDGCVVLMNNRLNKAHVGLFYCGRVLHLSERGVYFQDLRTMQRHYSGFKFYAP